MAAGSLGYDFVYMLSIVRFFVWKKKFIVEAHGARVWSNVRFAEHDRYRGV